MEEPAVEVETKDISVLEIIGDEIRPADCVFHQGGGQEFE